jgi:hypothetical protein
MSLPGVYWLRLDGMAPVLLSNACTSLAEIRPRSLCAGSGTAQSWIQGVAKHCSLAYMYCTAEKLVFETTLQTDYGGGQKDSFADPATTGVVR